MAEDIRRTVREANRPEALIVTIPSESVKDAVAEAVESGLPVFGLYSGYEHFEELGMQGFVAVDQKKAEMEAGNMFKKIDTET